jgi:hypothetical protein
MARHTGQEVDGKRPITTEEQALCLALGKRLVQFARK